MSKSRLPVKWIDAKKVSHAFKPHQFLSVCGLTQSARLVYTSKLPKCDLCRERLIREAL